MSATFTGPPTYYLGDDAGVDASYTTTPTGGLAAHVRVRGADGFTVGTIYSSAPTALRELADALAAAADEVEQAAERLVEAEGAA